MSLILLSALWLGILTSLSPCPLATNIAAISYIGKRIDCPNKVFIAGLLYTLGRTLTYIILGSLIVIGLLSVPVIANFLQKYMNLILGPILIIVGILLLEIINLNITGFNISDRLQDKVQELGVWGAGLLGILFALSFCPVSAALFFGSLIPMSIQHQSLIIYPALYGIGTALPVVVFALVIALSISSIGKIFQRVTQFEWWTRRITGIIFILAGIYLSLIHIFGLQLGI